MSGVVRLTALRHWASTLEARRALPVKNHCSSPTTSTKRRTAYTTTAVDVAVTEPSRPFVAVTCSCFHR